MPSHHLTHCERCRTSTLLHGGKSQREIAHQLGRDRGTISREMSRNCGQRGCRHRHTHRKATSRRREASGVSRKMTPERWEVVEDRVREEWSPEQIAGRYRLQGEVMAGREWICRHIRVDRRSGGTLYRHLRRRGKKPDWHAGRHAGRGHIPDRVDIAERPAVVEEKSRIGDRELDTVIGSRRRGALVTRWIGGRIRDRVHTFTADNGREFAGCQAVSEALTADFHFATPAMPGSAT